MQQHPRPLALGLSRRPSSTAYGPGPSVFTIRAKEVWHGSGKGLRVVGETACAYRSFGGLAHRDGHSECYRTVVRRKLPVRFSVCVSRSNPIRPRRGFRRPPRSTFPLAGGEERAVARRGAPPLPPMSLGTWRGCCRGGTPANASQMSPASEGTRSSPLATSDIGHRTLRREPRTLNHEPRTNKGLETRRRCGSIRRCHLRRGAMRQ